MVALVALLPVRQASEVGSGAAPVPEAWPREVEPEARPAPPEAEERAGASRQHPPAVERARADHLARARRRRARAAAVRAAP
jgi:hypothetical protein